MIIKILSFIATVRVTLKLVNHGEVVMLTLVSTSTIAAAIVIDELWSGNGSEDVPCSKRKQLDAEHMFNRFGPTYSHRAYQMHVDSFHCPDKLLC